MNIDNFSKHADTSKDKLQMIVACTQIVLRYVREHPVAGGVALLLTGGSITISAPLIIGIGTSACVTGELVISIAVWLGGTGVVIGSVNRSGETVRQSLYAGGIIGAIGAGIYVTGIFLKLSGYVMILYGGALTLIGLARIFHKNARKTLANHI